MVQDINDGKVGGEDVSLNGGPRTVFQTYVLLTYLKPENKFMASLIQMITSGFTLVNTL